MQTLEISDQTAQQLHDLAVQERLSGSELIERLVKKYSDELARQRELKVFFKLYQKDLSGFSFDRDEANER